MMNPFDETPPPYDFVETKVIAPPPSYKAVMVEAQPLPPPHFFEEDLDKLKKEMTLHEAKQYEYYLDLKKDIENIHKKYQSEIGILKENIKQLEERVIKLSDSKQSDKDVLIQNIEKKLSGIEFIVKRLDTYYPLEQNPRRIHNEAGYYMQLSYDMGCTPSWIMYRNNLKLNKIDGPHQYDSKYSISTDAIPYFIEYFGESMIGKILDNYDKKWNLKDINYIAMLVLKNANLGAKFLGIGLAYNGWDCNDFKDDSEGLITHDFEIRVLTYIHYKISNLYEYYQECMKYKEPTFDFSTIF
jgi:hypothetical protein